MSEFQSHRDRDNRINAPYGNTPLSETQSLEIIEHINDTKISKTTYTALVNAARHVARFVDSSSRFNGKDDNTDKAPFYYGSVVGYDLGTMIVSDGPIMTALAQAKHVENIKNYNHTLSTLPLRHQLTFDTRQSSGDVAPITGESIYDIGRQAFVNLLRGSNDAAPIAAGLNFHGDDLSLFNYGAGYSLNAAYYTEDINKEIKFLTRPSEITKFEDDPANDDFRIFIEDHYR